MKLVPFFVNNEEYLVLKVDQPQDNKVKISESTEGDLSEFASGEASQGATYEQSFDGTIGVETVHYTITDPANAQADANDDYVISRNGAYYVVPSGTEDNNMLNHIYCDENVELLGFVPNQYRKTELYKQKRQAAVKAAAAQKQVRMTPTLKTPLAEPFAPSFYGVVAPGVAAAVSAVGAYSGVAKISAMSLAAPLVITPALAGVLAYGFVYAGAQLQHLAKHGRMARPGEVNHLNINKAAIDSGQQLAGCLLGAGAATSIGYAMGMIPFESTWEFPDVSMLGTVEMKLALMVFAGIGLGLGLTAVVAYQDYRDKNVEGYQRKTASDYLATFLIGFGIGAACSVGYGNTVASYLMPGAATLLGLSLLPTTKTLIGGAPAAASATASMVSGSASAAKTYVTSQWDQVRLKSSDAGKDVFAQDHYDNFDNQNNNTLTL